MQAHSEDLGRKRLLEAFSSRSAVVFCGAGISLEPPAGLPDWSFMRDMTLESVISDEGFLQQYLPKLTEIPMLADPDSGSKGMTNEVVASTVAKRARNYFDCFESLKTGHPNANHLSLAGMARRGHIHTIITTNWDLFIERAMDELGVAYDAVRTEAEFADFRPRAEGGRVRILKLHGCLSKPAETIVATVEQEARGLWPVKQRALEGLLSEYLFVFWGYSGLDLKIHPDYLCMRSTIDRARGFVWDAYDEPNQYVQELEATYGERGTIVRRALPGVLDRFISLPERATLSDDEWDRWQHEKNAKLRGALSAWARENVGVFDAYMIVGTLLEYNGDTMEALACYQQMAQVAHSWPSPSAWCTATECAGNVYKILGRHVDSMNAYQEALRGFRQLGDDLNVFITLNSIAALYVLLGGYDRALAHFREAEQVARQHGWVDRLQIVFEGIGELYKNWGKAEEALTYYERALDESVAQGDQYSEARVLEKVATLYRNWGEFEQALSHCRRAENIYRSLGMRAGLAHALRNIGSIVLCQPSETDERPAGDGMPLGSRRIVCQEPEAVESYLREASELALQSGDRGLLSTIYLDQAILASVQGKKDEGRSFAERAVQLLRELGHLRELAIGLHSLSEYAPEMAVAYKVEALELLEKIHDRGSAAAISEVLGDHYRTTLNDPGVAQSYYERAMSHYHNVERYGNIPAVLHKIDLCRTAVTGTSPQPLGAIFGMGISVEPAWRTVLASACSSLLQGQEPEAEVDWQEGIRRVEERYGREEAAYRILREIHEPCQQLAAGGHWQTAVRCYQIAADAATEVGYLHRTSVLYNEAGLVWHRAGDDRAALEFFIKGERLARATNDETELITRLINLATTYQALGQPDDALSCYVEAEQIARRIDDNARLYRAIAALGAYHEQAGDYELALPYVVEAVRLARVVDDEAGVFERLLKAATTYQALGQPDDALSCYAEAEQIARRSDDPKRLCHYLTALGGHYREIGDYDSAMPYLVEAEPLAQELGDHDRLLLIYQGLGKAYREQGNYERSIHYRRACMELAAASGSYKVAGMMAHMNGATYEKLQQPAKAATCYAEARHHFEQAGAQELAERAAQAERKVRADAPLSSGAQLYEHLVEQCEDRHPGQGRQRAEGLLQRAATTIKWPGDGFDAQVFAHLLQEKYGQRRAEGMVYQLSGAYWASRHEHDSALEDYLRARDVVGSLQDFRWQLELLKQMSQVLQSTGQMSEAIKALIELGEAAKTAGALDALEQAHYQIGELCESQQRWEQALEHYRLAESAAREAEYRLGVGFDLFKIGLMHQHLGQYGEALEAYKGAQEIHKDHPDRSKLGNVLLMMGDTYAAMGDLQSAVGAVGQALKVATEARSRQGILACLRRLISLHEELGAAREVERYRQLAAQLSQSDLSD